MDPDNFQWVAPNSSENDATIEEADSSLAAFTGDLCLSLCTSPRYVTSSPDLASAPLPAHAVRPHPGRFRQPDPKRIRLKVCSQYMMSSCPLSEEQCDQAHPPPHVFILDETVTCCFFFVDENHECRISSCTFFHPPQHLKDEVLRRIQLIQEGAAGSNQAEEDGEETEEDRRPYPDLSSSFIEYRRTGESPLSVDTTEPPGFRAFIHRRFGSSPEGTTPGQSRLLMIMPPEYTDQPRPITWPQMGTPSIPPQQGQPGPSSVGMHPPLRPQMAQSHGLLQGPPVGRAMSNLMPPEYNQVHQFTQPRLRFTSATPDRTGSLPPLLQAHLESSTLQCFETMPDSPFADGQPRPPGSSWAASNPVHNHGSGLPTLQGPYPQYAAPGRLNSQPGPSMVSYQPPLLYQTIMYNQAPCPPLAPHGFHQPPQPPGAGVYAPSSAYPMSSQAMTEYNQGGASNASNPQRERPSSTTTRRKVRKH